MKKYLPYLVGGILLAAPVILAEPVQAQSLTPNDVSNAKVEWNFEEKVFDVSFTAPETGFYYDDYYNTVTGDLTSIDKIEVSMGQGYSGLKVIKTFENVTPGQDYSFKCTDGHAGANYNFTFHAYVGDSKSSGRWLYDCFAGGLPENIGDVEIETVKGQLPITLKFKAPEYYKGRDIRMERLDSIRIFNEVYDWSTYQNINTNYAVLTDVKPGQDCEVSIDNPAIGSGSQSLYMQAFAPDGAGDRKSIYFYIGEDAPGMVTNIVLAEQTDGSVLVSWEAPKKGANNGYFNPEGLNYTVTLYKNGEYSGTLLKDGLTENSLVYTPDATEPVIIAFGIKCSNANGTGSEARSGQTIVGPALTLPFMDGFNKTEGYNNTSDHVWSNRSNSIDNYPPTWRYGNTSYLSDANYTQVKPQSGEGGFAFINLYSSSLNADYSLVSSKIDVAGKTQLDLGFSYYHVEYSNTKLGVGVSFDGGASFIDVYTADFNTKSTDTGWKNILKTVDVPASATYVFIRLNCTKTGESHLEPTIVDEITLKETGSAAVVYPASVSDFQAVYNKAEGNVTVSFKAPTLSHASLGEVHGQPLESITRIELFRQIGYSNDYSLIKTFENPAPGEEITYADTDLAVGGEYYYKAVVYVENCCDYGMFLNNPVMVGQIPVDVNDLVATCDGGMAPVYLKFTAPVKDNQGNDLDEITRIYVQTYNNSRYIWEDLDVIENVTPGQKVVYTDNTVSTGQTARYRVIVGGTAGNSYGTEVSVYVGLDTPLAPSNVVATVNPDNTITITWDAPTEGANGGYIDVENLVYTVLRGNGYSDYDATVIKEGLNATEFTDPTEFTEETIVKYFVKATNKGFTGSSQASNTVAVGPASALPFVENFDVKNTRGYVTAEHSTWTTTSSDGSGYWEYAEMAYLADGQVTPVEGGIGLAYVYYGPYTTYERDDYLTSGNIDVEYVTSAELVFWSYGSPDYNSSLAAEVAYDKSGEFTEIVKMSNEYDVADAGWIKYTETIAIPEGAKTLQLRFHAHKGNNSTSIAIDNISLSALTVGVENVATGNICVTAAHGAIIVGGAADADAVHVYTASGMTVYSGNGNVTLPVAPGFYIVKAGNAPAVKVCVK